MGGHEEESASTSEQLSRAVAKLSAATVAASDGGHQGGNRTRTGGRRTHSGRAPLAIEQGAGSGPQEAGISVGAPSPQSAKRRRVGSLCSSQLVLSLCEGSPSMAGSTEPQALSASGRPSRQRIRPLEHWRNEQVVYERKQGSLLPTVVGVIMSPATERQIMPALRSARRRAALTGSTVKRRPIAGARPPAAMPVAAGRAVNAEAIAGVEGSLTSGAAKRAQAKGRGRGRGCGSADSTALDATTSSGSRGRGGQRRSAPEQRPVGSTAAWSDGPAKKVARRASKEPLTKACIAELNPMDSQLSKAGVGMPQPADCAEGPVSARPAGVAGDLLPGGRPIGTLPAVDRPAQGLAASTGARWLVRPGIQEAGEPDLLPRAPLADIAPVGAALALPRARPRASSSAATTTLIGQQAGLAPFRSPPRPEPPSAVRQVLPEPETARLPGSVGMGAPVATPTGRRRGGRSVRGGAVSPTPQRDRRSEDTPKRGRKPSESVERACAPIVSSAAPAPAAPAARQADPPAPGRRRRGVGLAPPASPAPSARRYAGAIARPPAPPSPAVPVAAEIGCGAHTRAAKTLPAPAPALSLLAAIEAARLRKLARPLQEQRPPPGGRDSARVADQPQKPSPAGARRASG